MISQLTEAARPAPELTHRLNEIVLTSDEAASLEALLQKARAVYDAAPEGAAYALRCHLDQLVRAVEDIASLRAHRRETSFDDEGGATAWARTSPVKGRPASSRRRRRGRHWPTSTLARPIVC
ncbi:hypothetical protein [Streptomyces albidoflavus]|uniref:hypothetical protein n=1 Tax=Streptomyces albidoflavus TaxID=1886 RepID=UPI00344B3EC2